MKVVLIAVVASVSATAAACFVAGHIQVTRWENSRMEKATIAEPLIAAVTQYHSKNGRYPAGIHEVSLGAPELARIKASGITYATWDRQGRYGVGFVAQSSFPIGIPICSYQSDRPVWGCSFK